MTDYDDDQDEPTEEELKNFDSNQDFDDDDQGDDGANTSTVAPGQGDNSSTSPAQDDSQSASGHTPDPEVDDDIDELGDEAGVHYSDNEELGIDHKYKLETESEPPTEDTPY